MTVKGNRDTMIKIIRIAFYDSCRAMSRNRAGHFVAFTGNTDTTEFHRIGSRQYRAAVSCFIAFAYYLKHTMPFIYRGGLQDALFQNDIFNYIII
ncbi:Uncharacterised protein [Klebsiella pneumoniae]|nr:Uncharacterised protein [Klebsiella pneumoniae]SLU35450.1 Uncharacterised protein [Klebsiella pneumoniae]SLU54691.1 Uncharacterised protein [Klebsiella pneumoniae]